METSLPEQNERATYRQVRAYGQDLLRRNVIETAARLLLEDGPEALTVRRLAEKLECSTKIIYTMFKGKDGLADALYLEGSARLAQMIEQIPPAETAADYLSAVAWVYWDFAQTYPGFYLIMFGGAIPHYRPSPTCLETLTTGFALVVQMLERYREKDALPLDDVTLVTRILWASAHGVVSLYLLGHFASQEEARVVFERSVDMVGSILTALAPPS